ncbi:MAG: cation:proton antiporter [Candidatus Baldrarchaeia archaeon]
MKGVPEIVAAQEILWDLFMYGVALFMGVLAAEACKRIRQSELIGQVLVGIILGPCVLGILRPSQVFDFISLIGALTLLFIAGLETDVRTIMRSGAAATILAVGGFIFTVILSMPLVLLFSGSMILAIFVSLALAATSIGITIRVFADFDMLRSWEAQTIVVAAVLDDLIVILLLMPIVKALGAGTISVEKFVEVLVPAGIFFLCMFIIGVLFITYIAPKFWLIKTRGGMFVFSFSFALLVGFLAACAGLSPIVGAYFAGLILAETDLKDDVLTEISPVAFVTVPIFMINIGMKINVGVAGEALLMGLAISVVAILGKILGGILAGKFHKNDNRSSYIMGVGMVPRGEMPLIFAEIGLVAGVINGMWYAVLVIVVLITTFLTPIVLKYLIMGGKAPHGKGDKGKT